MKHNEEFENWTTYDAWLVKNYSEYSITSVNEVNGKIICEYIDKSDSHYKSEYGSGYVSAQSVRSQTRLSNVKDLIIYVNK